MSDSSRPEARIWAIWPGHGLLVDHDVGVLRQSDDGVGRQVRAHPDGVVVDADGDGARVGHLQKIRHRRIHRRIDVGGRGDDGAVRALRRRKLHHGDGLAGVVRGASVEQRQPESLERRRFRDDPVPLLRGEQRHLAGRAHDQDRARAVQRLELDQFAKAFDVHRPVLRKRRDKSHKRPRQNRLSHEIHPPNSDRQRRTKIKSTATQLAYTQTRQGFQRSGWASGEIASKIPPDPFEKGE
jgi:hypothetical protein